MSSPLYVTRMRFAAGLVSMWLMVAPSQIARLGGRLDAVVQHVEIDDRQRGEHRRVHAIAAVHAQGHHVVAFGVLGARERPHAAHLAEMVMDPLLAELVVAQLVLAAEHAHVALRHECEPGARLQANGAVAAECAFLEIRVGLEAHRLAMATTAVGFLHLRLQFPLAARSSSAMSSFTIFMSAPMTRLDCAASLPMSLGSASGTICHDRPYLSLSQPHCTSLPPPAVSLSQQSSISFWSAQFTTNDTDSLNLKIGPPFSAMNFWPWISKSTVITVPFGSGPASPYRETWPSFE